MPMKQPIITKTADRRKEIERFLEKIVVGAGVGRLSSQPNFSAESTSSSSRAGAPRKAASSGGEEKKSILSQIMNDLALITGQKPHVRRAKKSIAGFKVREGQIVGLSVTLRGRKMVDFFERLVKVVLPRVRDFRGIDTKAVDAGGALSIGIREQFVFPEAKPEQSPVSFSLGVSLVPKRKNREEALKEFRELGTPLKKK